MFPVTTRPLAQSSCCNSADGNCMCELVETWTSQFCDLLQRFEAHDQRLQDIVMQWTNVQPLASRIVPDRRDEGDLLEHCLPSSQFDCPLTYHKLDEQVVRSCRRSLREEHLHSMISRVESVGSLETASSGASSVNHLNLRRSSEATCQSGRKMSFVHQTTSRRLSVGSVPELVDKLINSDGGMADDIKQKIRARTAKIVTEIRPEALVPQGSLASCVESWTFNGASAMVILFNMLVIIVRTEYESNTLTTDRSFEIISIILNAWYTFETGVKMLAFKLWFWTGTDRSWNILDAALALISIMDLALADQPALDSTKFAKAMRFCRLFRVLRILRIFRYVRFVDDFKKMVLGIVYCLGSLFWSTIVLAVVTWCFAVQLVQTITRSWMDSDSSSRSESLIVLRDMFGNTPQGMLYLMQAVTGGMDWGELSGDLFDVDILAGTLFLCYMFFTLFGVLNIITSNFVESAWRVSQTYRELLVSDNVRVQEIYIEHVRTIFRCLDVEGTGRLSVHQVEMVIEHRELQEYINALGVNTTDARMLFSLLDKDGSGLITCDEFVEGCLLLKGEASSFRLNHLIQMNEISSNQIVEGMTKTMKAFETVSHKTLEEIAIVQKDLHALRIALEHNEVRSSTSVDKENGCIHTITVESHANKCSPLGPVPIETPRLPVGRSVCS